MRVFPNYLQSVRLADERESLILLVNYCFFCDNLQPNTQKVQLASITTETPDQALARSPSKKLVFVIGLIPPAQLTEAVLTLPVLKDPEPPTPSSFD